MVIEKSSSQGNINFLPSENRITFGKGLGEEEAER
jgi:hypothetical protein